jgi:Ca-activated chloride channel homolog
MVLIVAASIPFEGCIQKYALSEIDESQLVTQGAIITNGYSKKQLLPLIHTDAKAEINGSLVRVTVSQTFVNPGRKRLNAVYFFPLPDKGTIDSLYIVRKNERMTGIFERHIHTNFNYIRCSTKTVSLEEIRQPSFYKVPIDSIHAKEKVAVAISYYAELPFSKGRYRFSFPIQEAPKHRFGKGKGLKHALPAKVRSGRDISLSVTINALLPIAQLTSENHVVSTDTKNDSIVTVKLVQKNAIPNKPFILSYEVSGKAIQTSVCSHFNGKEGYFHCTILPPFEIEQSDIVHRELIFIVDRNKWNDSINLQKKMLRQAIAGMRPGDRFNIFNLVESTERLSPGSIPADTNSIAQALSFYDEMQDLGPDEVKCTVDSLFSMPPVAGKKRQIIFLAWTNSPDRKDLKNMMPPDADGCSVFGIGDIHCMETLALETGGKYYRLRYNEGSDREVLDLLNHIETPLMTNIRVEINGTAVSDMLPRRLPDLYADAPVTFNGIYKKGGDAVFTVTGDLAGNRTFSQSIHGWLREDAEGADMIEKNWARAMIEQIRSTQYDVFNIEGYDYYSGDIVKKTLDIALQFKIIPLHVQFERRGWNGKWKRVDFPEGITEEIYRQTAKYYYYDPLYRISQNKMSQSLSSEKPKSKKAQKGAGSDQSAIKFASIRGINNITVKGSRSPADIQQIFVKHIHSLKYQCQPFMRNGTTYESIIDVTFSIDEFGKMIYSQIDKKIPPEIWTYINERIGALNFGTAGKHGDTTEVKMQLRVRESYFWPVHYFL